MKHPFLKTRRHREAGAALITALMVAVCTAMLLAASLSVALTSSELGWTQADSDAALELADAGANSELQYIALNVSASAVTGKSSQPLVSAGVTAVLPLTGSTVLGRQGTVSGYSKGSYYVYSSNNAAGTIPWDGVTSPFYITSSACVNGVWQTVQIQSTSTSLFNVYGIFALGSNPSSPTSITVAPAAVVNITGTAGTNGGCNKGSGCSFQSPCAINANCQNHNGGQFDSTCVTSGGTLCNVQPPLIYPKTADCLRSCFNMPSGTSDQSAWNYCTSNSWNQGTCYQYKDTTTNVAISPSNCKSAGQCPTSLTSSCWSGCTQKPCNSSGTTCKSGTKCQTLIFEPGDYYFSNIQLAYDATKEMIIDPCAYASGGTPGQVRFWVCNMNQWSWWWWFNNGQNDSCSQPIKNTCASGTSTPDPGQFRIYYGSDSCSLTFTRPSGCKDCAGNTVTGDFNYYCGIYSCTKPANDTNSQTSGTCVSFCGTSSASTGRCNLCGSMLCDQLSFQGCCNANYVQSQTCTKDPCSGGTVQSWSSCGG